MSESSSQPDVVDELTNDHRAALELLDRITAISDSRERRDLADVVIAEVVRHSVAEEMYVYPVMREHLDGGEDAVVHDLKEHTQLEEIMKQLEGLDATDTRFAPLVHEMRDALEHHAQEEEATQFPKLRNQVCREELIRMREKVDMAKRAAPTRPHPGAPHNELFHKLVGPGVGLVDRLRDNLAGRVNS